MIEDEICPAHMHLDVNDNKVGIVRKLSEMWIFRAEESLLSQACQNMRRGQGLRRESRLIKPGAVKHRKVFGKRSMSSKRREVSLIEMLFNVKYI